MTLHSLQDKLKIDLKKRLFLLATWFGGPQVNHVCYDFTIAGINSYHIHILWSIFSGSKFLHGFYSSWNKFASSSHWALPCAWKSSSGSSCTLSSAGWSSHKSLRIHEAELLLNYLLLDFFLNFNVNRCWLLMYNVPPTPLIIAIRKLRRSDQIMITSDQSSIKCGVSSQRNLCHFFGS